MIYKQFIKFAIVGIVATAIHVGMVIFLVEKYTLDPVLSSIPAYIFALLAAYMLNKIWTFEVKATTLVTEFIPYSIVSTIGFGLNILIMYVLIEQMNINYLYSLITAVVIVPVVTFTLHKYWTFSHVNKSL